MSLDRNKFAVSTQFNRLRRHLSSVEIDVLFKIATMIDKDDQDFKDYEIDFKEFERSLGKRLDRDFFSDKIALSLMTPFQIKEDKRTTTLAFFSCLEYDRSTFFLKARFDKSMKPFFLDLKQFVKADFRQIVKMKSEYSKRIYMILKQWESLGSKKFDLLDLQNELCVPSSLLDYGQFKRRALAVAVKEINLCTDLKVDYKEIKNGRTVIEIDFSIVRDRKQTTISDYTSSTISSGAKEKPWVKANREKRKRGEETMNMLNNAGFDNVFDFLASVPTETTQTAISSSCEDAEII